MLAVIAIVALIAASVFAVSGLGHVSADEKEQSLKEMQNFKPKITTITKDGKTYQIVEFYDKLKKD